uniref:Uncharacterized protein n=1 Tax=Arundo donax TaxID=35708 RepID=A0A0A9HQT4_ARUDO
MGVQLNIQSLFPFGQI